MNKIFATVLLLFLAIPLYAQETGSAPSGQSDTPVTAGLEQKDLPASVSPDVSKAQPQSGYTPPDAATRRKRFTNSVIGPFALGRQVASAGIATWRNSPEEWKPTWEGFGRRLASNFGKNVIKQSTKFGLDEALKVDSHFYRSQNKSVGARITNALISPVTARTRSGKRTIGIPNLVGTYGANIIAYETWYPNTHDWKDGLRGGTFSLGFTAAFNLVKEFILKK